MGANNTDKFILEISAKINSDTKELTSSLRTALKNIEKNTKLNLKLNDEQITKYIEKLKSALDEINASMNHAGIEANSTSFKKFVNILEEAAMYSEEIGKNLKLAASVVENLDRLQELNNSKKKDKNTDTTKTDSNDNNTNREADKLKKQNENNLKKQIKAKKEIQKLYSDMANDMDKKSNSSEVMKSRQKQISEQYKKLKELEKEQSIIIQKYKEINSSEKLATINDLTNTKEYESFNKAKNKASLDLAKRNAKLDDRYSNYSGFNKNEELYNKYENSTYKKYVDMYNDTIGKYEAKINEIKSSNVTDFDISELTAYENKLKEILKILNDNDFKNPKMELLLDDNADIEEAKNAMKNLLETKKGYIKESLKESTSTSNSNKNIVKMTASYRTADKQIKDITYTYNKLTGAIIETRDASKSVALTSKFDTFGDKLNKKFGDLSTYLLSFASFYEVVDVMKQGFSIIKDLDTQLTEMEKVSNESLSNLKAYAKSSYSIASEIGTTGKELQASTADYMRLGKSLQDASELAKTTNVLMNVSEFESIDKATESMISMTQAYQELDSMDIVDKLNLTGNNYSISTDELAQSLQKSASALKTAKNDFDEAIALTVAGNSVVQDPDSVAAGIRTIALRMTGTDTAKKELEDMGEEADNVLTKSKLNDTLEMLTNIDSRGGISLLDDNGNYRSTAKVLMDLAERWQDIGEQDVKDGQNRQNALLEALAGKNRSNILASILNDPNLLKDVYNDVSTNYQGSAMKENEKQMQSIEGHLKQLQNTWQEFWADDNNREFINSILDLANAFLQLLNNIGGAKTALAGLVYIFAKFKWKDEINGVLDGVKSIISEILLTGESESLKSLTGKLLGDGKGKGLKGLIGKVLTTDKDVIPDNAKEIMERGIAEKSLTDLLFGNKNKKSDISQKDLKKYALGEKVFDVVEDDIVKNAAGVEEVVEKTTSSAIEGGLEGASSTVVKSSGGLAKALENGLKFLFTSTIGKATLAGAAVIGTKVLIDKYKKSLEQASENLQTQVDDHKEEKSTLDQFKQNIPAIAEEYDKLRKGVSSTGENISLTNDEFERYNELSNQIANTFPQLVSGYSSTNAAILTVRDSVKELNAAYDEALQKQAQESLDKTPYETSQKAIKNANWELNKSSNKLLSDAGTNSFSLATNQNAVKFANFTKGMRERLKGKVNDKALEKINFDYYEGTNGRFDYANQTVFKQGLSDFVKNLAFDNEEYNNVLNELKLQSTNGKDEDTKKQAQQFQDYVKNEVSKYKKEINNASEQMKIVAQSQDAYYEMDQEKRTVFDKILGNLTESDYKKFGGSEKDIKNLLKKFSKYSVTGANEIDELDNYRQLYDSDTKISDVKKIINKDVEEVAKGTGLSKDSIEQAFQIDDSVFKESEDKIVNFYDNLSKQETGAVIRSEDFQKKQREQLEETFDANQMNTIGENMAYMSDDIMKNYVDGFKNYYDSFEEYFLDVLQTMSTSEKSYIGENKSFADLESNASTYSSTLAQLNNIGNDNVVVNSELAQTLTSMGDGFKEYIQWSEDGSTATITNTQAVKDLVKAEQEKAVLDARNSKSQAIKNYKDTTDTLVDLTNQLEETANSEGKLDESILSNIQSTEIQLNTLKRNIEYYEQLETKLLGATNAFDAYNLAVQQDQSQNTFESTSSMLDTIKSGLETGMMGTASFDAALQGLVSNSRYNEIMNTEDIDTRIQKMKSSYDKIKSYFKKDSNGNPTLSGIENFVKAGYDKELFDSRNVEEFDLADNIGLEDFVEKMDLSKESVFSLFETIEKFNLDKDNSIFDKLLGNSDTLTKSNLELKKATNELEKQTKLKENLLVERSKTDKSKEPKKWQDLTDKISKCNNVISEQTEKQREANKVTGESVEQYINLQDEIKNAESKADLYRKKLKDLKDKKSKGEKVSDKEITELQLKTDEAEKKLDNLISKRDKLGKPVKVDLEIAKEKVEDEIQHLEQRKVKLEAEIAAPQFTSPFPLNSAETITKVLENKKELDDVNKELKDKQFTLQKINVELGISATINSEYDSTVAQVKVDKEELGKDVKFDIKALGISKAIKDINSVKNTQKTLKDKDILTTHTIIETTIKKKGGGKATAIQAVRNTVKSTGTTNILSPSQQISNGLFNLKSKKSSNAFGQNNSKSTFNYFGKAYANGRTTNGKLTNVSSHSSGNTLVGELGAETIVDPYEGTYKVVGINGAEFVNIPKDAIVFNHQQTRELQKSGKIKSRGAIVSNSSGFMQGFAKVSPIRNSSGNAYVKTKPKTSSGSGGSGNSGNSGGSSNKKKEKSSSSEVKSLLDNLFDWIEIKLQRISDKTQKYMTLAENAISKTVKEAEYKYAISSTKSEINNNQAASKKYKSYANSLITKAKKNGVSKASAYAKKVRDGSISLQSISNEKILDFVNSYKEMYDKAKECDSAILSLSSQLSDLAESFYNIPTEYAEKKIEKFSDKMDVLSAKLDITKTYQNQNKILDKQTSLQKNIMKAYNSASKTTNSNFISAKGKINSTKDRAFKGLNSKQKKAIIAKVKSGEEVHISPKYSATLQSAIANYNKALEANRIAYNNAQKASAEYTKALRDNTKAKYDNITAYYDGRKGIDNSHISKNDAILEYRTAMGYSNTSDAQKSVIKNKIKYEKERLGFINEELKTYDPTKLKKDYNSGKLSKDDYYSMLQHRQELEEEYYSTKTSLINLNKEIKNLKITHLDYIIDGISSALEKFKNYISLKEVRGDKATETDYTDQIKYEENQIDILYNKYKELEKEKASYAVESEEYKRVTDEQANISSEALQSRQNINEIVKSVNEIRFKPLEDANASLERQIDDIEHLKDILSKDELIDDNGNFTDSGLASIALIGKQMENSKKLIVNYRNGLEKLTESYKNGNLTLDEYNEQSREYIKSIQDAVSAVDNYKSALIDMYKQQLEAENDTLQKTIDKRKEALQAKKDYYSYDKTIKNASKDINSLKNQIAALEGVGNAAAKAEVERLKSQLSEAEENLEDTKYEHLVELKLTGYDEMSKSADEVLKNLLEDITTNADMQEQVISNMLDNVVKNYTTAYDTIKKTINETAINTETSNSLSLVDSILTLSDTLTKGFDKIEKTYGDINTGNIYKEGDNTSDALGVMVGKPSSGNTDRTIVKIVASPKSVSLKAGESKTVKCKVTPSDAKLTVTSSNVKVATASISGSTITVVGGSKGSATITISGKNGGATASVGVTVTASANVPKPSGGDKPVNKGGNKNKDNNKNNGGNTGGNTGGDKKQSSSHAGLVSNLSGNITSSSSSANIKKVQTALKGLQIKGKDGKALTIDGKWGTNTDYAVKYFQRLNKWTGALTADGIIGTKTKTKFKKAGYYKGGIVDNVMSLNNTEFFNMLRMNKDDGLITAKLGEGIIPKNIMPNFTQQLEKFNSLPADKILNNISNTTPNLEINVEKFMDVHGNIDKNCVNDLQQLQNDITNNITKTLTSEFRKLGYK